MNIIYIYMYIHALGPRVGTSCILGARGLGYRKTHPSAGADPQPISRKSLWMTLSKAHQEPGSSDRKDVCSKAPLPRGLFNGRQSDRKFKRVADWTVRPSATKASFFQSFYPFVRQLRPRWSSLWTESSPKCHQDPEVLHNSRTTYGGV